MTGETDASAEVEAFVASLAGLDRHPLPEVRGLLVRGEEAVVTRAPGRLDVMGGFADYSGSLVLQLPLREATLVALQKDREPRVRIVSLGADSARSFEAPMDALAGGGGTVEDAAARAGFGSDPARRWAAYAAGAFVVLARERGVAFRSGARLLITSRVPEGSGVSSSAALEVAVMQAVAEAFDVALAPRELALLAQQVENRVVGAACGVMDQMTAACGEEGRLLALRCQPAELEGHLALPEDLAVWGIDSGVCHAVSGADYTSVRIGAFMGYRILAERAGLPARRVDAAHVAVDDARWGGCLANVTPAEYRESFAAHVPASLRGEAFLARYGGTTDAVTRVSPEVEYPVRAATVHPIEENFRVRAFARELAAPAGERRNQTLGDLMSESHASYTRCGLGSAATERLATLVHEKGRAHGLYGARITGGGSGGTVAVLGRRDAGPRVAEIAEGYARESGRPARVFSGSSPGAAVLGPRRARVG